MNNLSYKWRKIFASINYCRGKIELTPEEAQELIDDIDKEIQLKDEEIYLLKAEIQHIKSRLRHKF